MKKVSIILCIFILSVCAFAQNDTMFVSIGDIDGESGDSIIVTANTWIDVPIFFLSGTSQVGCSEIVYPLGINNCYFDSIDVDNCLWRFPFNCWDNVQFGNWNPDWQTDSNGCTWDSYSFIGIAEEESPYQSPFLRTDPTGPPRQALTFRVHTVNIPATLDSASSDAIGPGFDPDAGYAYCSCPHIDREYEVHQSFSCYMISANRPPDQFEVTLPDSCSYENFSVNFDIRDPEGNQPDVTSNFGAIIFDGFTDDGEARIFNYTLSFDIENSCGSCIDEEIIVTAIDPNRPDLPVMANAGEISFLGELTVSMDNDLEIWPGEEEWMPVYLDACGGCFCLGGFEFTIAYDDTCLTITDVMQGEQITGGEYWNVSYNVEGPGTVGFTFINDLNNEQPAEDICEINPDEPVFLIKFLLAGEPTYPYNFSTPIWFINDEQGQDHYLYNFITDNETDYMWVYDACDNPPDSIVANFLNLNLECGNISIFNGPCPYYGDINMNGYTFELGDAVLLANHIVDPDSYPFTLYQMISSDVNGDGLRATIADLVYLTNVISGYFGPKVAPIDVIAELSMAKNDNGDMNIMIDSESAIGGALIKIDHTGIELGKPVADGMDIHFIDNGDVMTVLVFSMEANSLPSGSNILFSLPVLSEGEISFGDVSVSDNRGALLDARIARNTPLPERFSLSQNFPNPFNAVTSISYILPESKFVRLGIYDLLGREIDQLVNEHQAAGEYIISYDASGLSSGIYFYRIQAGGNTESRKMVLLK
ncbi:MAG: T9SS type A sorting domain-containing protein [candidate division Zixibacteria bacterium]|nr:T9SS type A sorting domain-containing protein [candidate division Zixibacteria bacterium]